MENNKKMAALIIAGTLAVTIVSVMVTWYFTSVDSEKLHRLTDTNVDLLDEREAIMRENSKLMEAYQNLTHTAQLKIHEVENLNATIKELNIRILELREQNTFSTAENTALNISLTNTQMQLRQSLADVEFYQTQIDTLQNQLVVLTHPKLILVDMKLDYVGQFWFWDAPSHVHVYGYIVNLHEQIASDYSLHVRCVWNGSTLLEFYRTLPTIQGESFVRIDFDYPYSGGVQAYTIEIVK